VKRRQEQKVEDQHGGDRHRNRVGEAAEDGDRHDREHVEDAETDVGRHRPQRVDAAGHDRDRGDAEAHLRDGAAHLTCKIRPRTGATSWD
jgi:hypothetical protein